MQIIRGIDSLKRYLAANNFGCLADTGLLYASADTDDRLNDKGLELFEALEEFDVPIYVNVISRMEFVDLIFRKQLTVGAIQAYEAMDAVTSDRTLFNFLKSIRDENTAQLRDGQSYKIPEGKLKKLRANFESIGPEAWPEFCQQYSGEKLSNEWKILEEEMGLHFIEVMEGGTSDTIEQPLRWADMIKVMGHEGLRGPDAMIVNLFLKSRLPLLITTDGDIISSFKNADPEHAGKSVYLLD